jgi:hypothetical protein
LGGQESLQNVKKICICKAGSTLIAKIAIKSKVVFEKPVKYHETKTGLYVCYSFCVLQESLSLFVQ